jgi:hypothetical protein
MLEPWIIEQIRRREEEERRRHERPQLEIPSGDERNEHWRKRDDEDGRGDEDNKERDKGDKPERGVLIIDFG